MCIFKFKVLYFSFAGTVSLIIWGYGIIDKGFTQFRIKIVKFPVMQQILVKFPLALKYTKWYNLEHKV